MSDVWQRWLTAWCGVLGVLGVVLAGAGTEATSGPVRLLFAVIGGPGELRLDPHMRLTLAVLGAVLIGWSLTLLGATRVARRLGRERARSLWSWVTVSLVGWFVIDSTLSMLTGFPRNAVMNTIFIVAFLLPIVRSRVLTA
jgi:hypothetical protein